jgi:hypothetical protein
MKFFIMVHSLSLCLIGYTWYTLEVFVWLSCLAFEIVLGSHDTLLVRAICFLVVVVVTGNSCDPLGAPLLPLFTVFGAFFSAFAGGFRRCTLAVVGDHFPIALNNDDPDRLFDRSVSGGDIKKLLAEPFPFGSPLGIYPWREPPRS